MDFAVFVIVWTDIINGHEEEKEKKKQKKKTTTWISSANSKT